MKNNFLDKIDQLNKNELDNFLEGLISSILKDRNGKLLGNLNMGVSENSFIWFDFSYEDLDREFCFTFYEDGTMYLEELKDFSTQNEKRVKESTSFLYNPLNIYKHLKTIGLEYSL